MPAFRYSGPSTAISGACPRHSGRGRAGGARLPGGPWEGVTSRRPGVMASRRLAARPRRRGGPAPTPARLSGAPYPQNVEHVEYVEHRRSEA